MKNQCSECKKGFNNPINYETKCFCRENASNFLAKVNKPCELFEKRRNK